MIISVVNHSEYADEYVQEILRAINRQIAEDFAPYWHRAGELRLEGAAGRLPNPRNPQELRGDAILYLWDELDQVEALGYHDLNYRGIPFGIVFTQLSDEMGEDWTVTLSHEALELLTDPEANLLVEGPHPDDPERRVHHWYEVCDAVQAQSYEIDGIAVSNFVLPLYFTEGDEKGSRNDFLGGESDDGPLASFGVAPGGYVGFFDPETQEHDQYVSPHGGARDRLAARLRAGWARRAVRRQRETSPEPVLRRILQRSSDAPLPGPWFEGFAVDVRPRADEDPYDVLEVAARAALGPDWERHWLAVEPTRVRDSAAPSAYELVPRDQALPSAGLWDRCYALREQRGIVDVEPDFVCFRPDSEAISDLPARRRWDLFGRGDRDSTDRDYEWSLDLIRAPQAWALAQGERVTIGQPDTGYLPHPEIWPEAGGGPIDTSRDWDFVADEDDARAELDENDPLPGGPNHGTSMASVIVSAVGPPDGDRTKPFVSGVAPKATLVPLRVSNSVVHFGMRRVRKAIEYATAEGFHVLSMSLGGPLPNRHLRAAIQEAERRGLILIAAAGNYIPFRPVVWPARYPEVIAVAACNVEEKPWFGSSRGGAIDVTAPGESVWRAKVDDDAPPSQRYLVERSSGTSYATASVAGVCALWLSHHGWRPLFEKYGEHLADAFRYLLRETARPSEHLDPGDFGAGIVDAEALLRAPLPSRQAVVQAMSRSRARRARAGRPDEGALENIGALFPHLSRTEVRRGLEGLLDTDARGLARRLREVGDELVFQFATDPRLCRQFSSRCRSHARMRATGAAARRWRALGQADLRERLRRTASSRLAASLK